MSKFKNKNYLELEFPGSTTTQRPQNINHTRKIKPLLWYKGVSPHDRNHTKQKRVRRYKVMTEYENYPEELSFTLQKHPYSSRYSYQKQVQRLYVCFPTLDTLIKIVTNIPSRYTGLKGLHISLKGVIKGESLGRISKCLSKLARVKALTLALYQKQLKIKDNSISNLDKSLAKLKRLKNLNLSFTENKIHAHQVGMVLVGSIFEVKDRGMVIFPHLFSLLTNLVKIDLAIIEQNTVTDGELEHFGYRLSKLQNLTNLSLTFIDCLSLSFKGFNAMLTQLAQLPQLNTLGIGFPIFEGIGREMEVPTYHPIWQLESLVRTNLEIKLYAMFETELMDGLAASVANINSLEKLVLICNRAQFVINRHINALMHSISKLPKVYHLDLDFVICQSLHASLANNIMYYITTMPNLQTVSLNFQTCFKRILGPPPQGMEIVMDEQLSRTQSQITKLALGYVDCQEMKEDQVVAMINLIKMCPNIKDLTVKLNWCKILSEGHVLELIQTISGLKDLESLAIEFQGRYKGTRESFIELKKLRLPHLRSLDINISNWIGVIDQDIHTLGKWIANFTNLEELKLNFKNCKGLSDFHAEKVCNYLVNLSRLRNLAISWTAVKLRETSNNIAGLLEKALPRLCYIQFYSGNTRVWMWMKD